MKIGSICIDWIIEGVLRTKELVYRLAMPTRILGGCVRMMETKIIFHCISCAVYSLLNWLLISELDLSLFRLIILPLLISLIYLIVIVFLVQTVRAFSTYRVELALIFFLLLVLLVVRRPE